MHANVETIDRMLDELESYAASESSLSAAQFSERVLKQLVAAVDGLAAVYLAPRKLASVQLAASGKPSLLPLLSGALRNTIEEREKRTGQVEAESKVQGDSMSGVLELNGDSEDIHWLAVPSGGREARFGWLAVALKQIPSPTEIPNLQGVASAFADVVATRQFEENERFTEQEWDRIQFVLQRVAHSETRRDAASFVVNGLIEPTLANRIALVSSAKQTSRQERWIVSGVAEVDLRSPVISALSEVADEVRLERRPLILADQGGPQVAEQQSRDALFPNLLAFPMNRCAIGTEDTQDTTSQDLEQNASTQSRSDKAAVEALVFEFANRSDLFNGITRLTRILPILETVWLQQTRWQSVPAWLRGPHSLIQRADGVRRWVSGLVWAAVAVIISWWLLSPAPLYIDADGVLEPTRKRVVYASESGFIERVSIQDDAKVSEGDVLISIRSPKLDLAIETATGARRVLLQEIAGIRVSANQIVGSETEIEQSRLAARIEEAEIELKSLDQQIELLQERSEALVLRAPISGFILGRHLQQRLAGIPVQQGDPILEVVDLDGPWHARLKVADSDSHYVQEHYPVTLHDTAVGEQGDAVPLPVDLTLLSDPDALLTGNVNWIGRQVETDRLLHNFLEVHAELPDPIPTRVRVGSAVEGHFHCGDAPNWYVWSRPVVESLQRQFWMWTGER